MELNNYEPCKVCGCKVFTWKSKTGNWYCSSCGTELEPYVSAEQTEIERLQSQLATRDALIERLVEAGNDMAADCEAYWYALHIPVCTPVVNWRALVDKYSASKDGGGM